ncbi:GIY-YIG nuclease family protein [Bacillus thuringiensis]|uniref:GIY-YIG nuclease family protein n=1 Tax=Bacillus thuringiensis TaxID=1428 RepID=UPI000BF29550|nr:hypothetical protein CN346_22330 [Bacillus thuringiensis]
MRKQKESDIYKIQCSVNGRIYIGQSRDLKTRLSRHKRNLRDGTHENKALQSARKKQLRKTARYYSALSLLTPSS